MRPLRLPGAGGAEFIGCNFTGSTALQAVQLDLARTAVDVQSAMSVKNADVTAGWLGGEGSLELQSDGGLNFRRGEGPTTAILAADVGGSGEVNVEFGVALTVEKNTRIRLTQADERSGGSQSGGSLAGKMTVDGELFLRGTIEDTDVDLKLVRLEDGATLRGTVGNLVESSQGFGGEFAVNINTLLQSNDLTFFPDRILGLPVTQVNNVLRVEVPTFVSGAARGGRTPASFGDRLELRAFDEDGAPTFEPGAFQLADSPGFLEK